MERKICISCGLIIKSEALHDSNICKDCEDLMIDVDENTYIIKV